MPSESTPDDWMFLHGLDRLREYLSSSNQVPTRSFVDSDGFPLGAWVRKVSAKMRAGTLEPSESEALAAIGFRRKGVKLALASHAADWDRGLDALRTWIAREGETPLRGQSLDGFPVGDWLASARVAWRHGQLSFPRVAALEGLGIGIPPSDHDWWRKRNLFAAQREGRVLSDAEREAVGAWLGLAGRHWRRGTLSADKVRALEALGLVGRFQGGSWDWKFGRLEGYVRTHGAEPRPDHVEPDGFMLGRWLADQREAWTAKRLSAARVDRLRSLGLTARVSRPPKGPVDEARKIPVDRFAEALGDLVAYRDGQGGLEPPASHPLGSWLLRTRKRWREGALDGARVAALEAAGVAPGPEPDNQADFEARLSDLRERLASGEKPTRAQSTWLSRIRLEWLQGRVPDDRAAALDGIGIPFTRRRHGPERAQPDAAVPAP